MTEEGGQRMNTLKSWFVRSQVELRHRLAAWMTNEDGADMAEYALVLVLIAVVAFVAVQGVGDEVTCAFNKIVQGLQGNAPAC
jgi:Flp pilus assembly pilin Flp